MTSLTKGALQLALVAAAALSLAACASTKPAGPGPTTAPSGPPESTYTPPNSPGPVSEGQIPSGAAPGSIQDFVINAGDVIYFDTDSYSLRDDAHGVLDAQAGWLRRYAQVRVRIEGNCDERGTREYNFALGSRRANTVRDYLVSRGVQAGRITTISYGKERPIDGGSSEDAWQKNRNARTAITEGAR